MGIVGASGSGKSTLMSILGGLDRPTAGRVRVDGQDLLRMPDRQLNRYRREKVGFVWQQSSRNLVPYLNAVQNVMLPMTLAGITGSEQQERAEELLDMVGLSDRMTHHLPELSGGEQQRVGIAVALANHPKLLLGDEPTGEVDSTTAKVIYETFQKLTHDLGITTLLVSHDPEIARHVDRVVRIRDGMLASETRRQLRNNNGANAPDGAGAADGETQNGAGGEEEHYQELVVLDRAGRVHVPQEYLEQFDISGRAQLEVTEQGILIRRADMEELADVVRGREAVRRQRAEADEGKLRGWVKKLRRR
jgi:ABC-type lipoprotein export system ATPase subunit